MTAYAFKDELKMSLLQVNRAVCPDSGVTVVSGVQLPARNHAGDFCCDGIGDLSAELFKAIAKSPPSKRRSPGSCGTPRGARVEMPVQNNCHLKPSHKN